MNSLELQISCDGSQGFSLELDCQLPARGVTAIYGPSGSGKSTLLDCIAGLREAAPDSIIRLGGDTWLDRSLVTPCWQRRIGYVFQDARLFPHLNVKQNLLYGRVRRPQSSAISLERVVAALDLQDMLGSAPATLSAGQRQRVAIGRALLSTPRLLLLDEPLANLDHQASLQCLRYLQRLGDEFDLPMLYVSHDIEEVSQLADHLVLLEQGRLVDQGSLLALSSRLDTRLSREEQAAAIVTAVVARHDEQFGLTELAMEGQPLFVNQLQQAPGGQRRVRIPARDVSVCRQRPEQSSILNILAVSIAEIEASDGARLLLRLSLGSQYLLARITRKSAAQLGLRVGDELYAQVKSAALLMETVDGQ